MTCRDFLRMLTAMGIDDEALQEKGGTRQDRMTQLDMAFTMKEIDELLTGIGDGTTARLRLSKAFAFSAAWMGMPTPRPT